MSTGCEDVRHAPEQPRVEQARRHLREALRLIDTMTGTAEIGARLQEVIDNLQNYCDRSA